MFRIFYGSITTADNDYTLGYVDSEKEADELILLLNLKYFKKGHKFYTEELIRLHGPNDDIINDTMPTSTHIK